MRFVHLHVHSHYSLLDGLPKIDALLDQTQKLGMDAIALTDHGVLYGAIEFYKKAVKKGIKPIIGQEVYIAPHGMHQKRAQLDEERYHLTLLAYTITGYRNLIQLTTKAHLEGFYYKPRVDKDLLRKYSDGLIALSGCLSGEIPKALLAGNTARAEELLLTYRDIFGKENFYLEISHHPNVPGNTDIRKGLLALSRKFDTPLVATHDVHYLHPDDREVQDVLMAIQTGNRIDDEERLTIKTDDFSLRSPEEMADFFRDVPEAIENTVKIADRCSLALELGTIQLPKFPVPKRYTADSYLRELCYKGLEKRYPMPASPDVVSRLDHELCVIEKTGFASYFLIVQDFVNWAKKNGIIVGPGRGSAAGSIVSYLLNITTVDPIAYGLLFERFMTPERISPPDIDLDFTDTRRDEVIEYVAERYGRDHVAQIITFGTMAARAAVRDAGRALGYPYSFCDQIAKMIPMFASIDQALTSVPEMKRLAENDQDVLRLTSIARKLEGVARHASTHACGVVITREPLTAFVPRQYAVKGGRLASNGSGARPEKSIVTQYEMHSIEDLGLLKIDLLGLKNLTIIEETLRSIQTSQNKTVDIERLPLNDPDTFKLLQSAKTCGVFQLESAGMRRYLKQLRPTHLEDIIAMVSLFRPGPMDFIPEYISRKEGKTKIAYVHPALKPILEKTYGIAVYQEQVMEIAKVIAGFTLQEADTLRKAIGKKIKTLLAQQREKFIQGAVKNQIPKASAEKIFDWIEPFARYGFNRSHGACYALIAYQTAYLKIHYPAEFMASLLNAERKNIDRLAVLIEESKRMGIPVLPPDINESYDSFSILRYADDEIQRNPTIRFGLSAIKNVGHSTVHTIIGEREKNGPYSSIENFLSRIPNRDFNKKSLEALIKSGALDSQGERGTFLANIEELLQYSRASRLGTASAQQSLFGDDDSKKTDMALRETPPALPEEKLAWEKEHLGLYVSAHPMDHYQSRLKQLRLPITPIKDIGTKHIGKRITVSGIVGAIQKVMTKMGKPMLFLQIEDLTDRIEVLVFPSLLEKTPLVFQKDKIVLIKGKVNDKDGVLKVLCDEARDLAEILKNPSFLPNVGI